MALPTPPGPPTFQFYGTSLFSIGDEVMFDPSQLIAGVSFVDGQDENGKWIRFNVAAVRGVRGVVEDVGNGIIGTTFSVRFPFHVARLTCRGDILVSYVASSSLGGQTEKSNGVCVCDVNVLMRGGCACGAVTRYKPPGIIS